MRDVPTDRLLRAVGALLLLAVVLAYALGAVARYRSSGVERPSVPAAETTSSAAPEDDAGADEPDDDEDAPDEGEGSEEGEESGPTVVVKVDGLNFRREPDKNASVIRGLSSGERLELLKTEGGWHYAEDSDGEKGWLYASEQYSTVEE
ncbi:MAG: SH3 domain-containing protein [Coriobacteriia bacterium]|nr:SH3 domain-containing protein [Coriobacteriia bacterium]